MPSPPSNQSPQRPKRPHSSKKSSNSRRGICFQEPPKVIAKCHDCLKSNAAFVHRIRTWMTVRLQLKSWPALCGRSPSFAMDNRTSQPRGNPSSFRWMASRSYPHDHSNFENLTDSYPPMTLKVHRWTPKGTSMYPWSYIDVLSWSTDVPQKSIHWPWCLNRSILKVNGCTLEGQSMDPGNTSINPRGHPMYPERPFNYRIGKTIDTHGARMFFGFLHNRRLSTRRKKWLCPFILQNARSSIRVWARARVWKAVQGSVCPFKKAWEWTF